MIPLPDAEFVEVCDRGHLPATRVDHFEVVDLFDTLLEAGHTVQEACAFLVALAEGRVA